MWEHTGHVLTLYLSFELVAKARCSIRFVGEGRERVGERKEGSFQICVLQRRKA